MYYTVYKTTNLVNGKIYIGFHSTNDPYDEYLGSGKLLKRAILKYGYENFKKDVIACFLNKKCAEELERFIVNKEFVSSDDNYNLSIGGNVCILYGEANGYYGKKHTKETIDKIQSKRSKTINQDGYSSPIGIKVVFRGKEYDNFSKAIELSGEKSSVVRREIGNPNFIDSYVCEQKYRDKLTIRYLKRCRRVYLKRVNSSKSAKIRFSGVTKSEDHKQKISKANKGRINFWQDKINKNPEKIRKTAEKHKGMKRSEIAKDNMSKAQQILVQSEDYVNPLKGKTSAYNPDNKKEFGYFLSGEIPNGWVTGNPNTSKKCYYDPITLLCKRFSDDEIPDGWLRGNPNIKKKNKDEPNISI